jgi:tetratricopeptide (TPR) repeat protein
LLSSGIDRFTPNSFRFQLDRNIKDMTSSHKLQIALLSMSIMLFTELSFSFNSAFANSILRWRGSANEQVNRIAQTPTISQDDKSKEIARDLAKLDRAIQQNPRNAEAYRNRGELKLDKLNDIQGALADYNKAIALKPKDAKTYISRGDLKRNRLNDSSGALADYNKAIQLKPRDSNAYNNRGLLKVDKLNDAAGALADYNKAIELDPKYVHAYNNRGLLKVDKLNDAAGALADYNKAIELDPKSANTALANSIDNTNQVDRSTTSIVKKDLAKEMYDLAKLKEVDFDELLEKVAIFNRAMDVYNNTPSLNNGFRKGYVGFGGDLDRSGILPDYNKAIELCPECVVYYYDRGNFKSKLNDLSGALADYNKAIELSPEYANAYKSRALLKEQKIKDRAGAIQDYRQAAKIYRKSNLSSDLQATIDKLKELGASE